MDRIAQISDYAQHARLARWSAGLVAPGRPLAGGDDLTPADGEALPAFLKRNKLPLLTLWDVNLPQVLNLREVRPFAEALRREEDAFASQRAEYEIVRAGWLAEGIEGMFLKAVGLPPAFPHASDNLDVYVPPAQGQAARQVLRRLGYVEMRHLEEPNKYLFKRFRAGQEVCAVHLHLRLEWSVSFLPEAQVWARRRVAADDAALSIPSPEDALLITLAHALYENKSLKLGDLARVNHCLDAAGLDWEYIWGAARSKGWEPGLALALLLHDRLDRWLYAGPALPAAQRAQAEARLGGYRRGAAAHLAQPARFPFPISFLLSKRLFFEKILTDENEAPARRLADAATHLVTGTRLKLRLRGQSGRLITVSGVEGSGKSTQARALESAFRQCNELRVRYVWSRGGASRLAAGMIRVGKRLVGPPSPVPDGRGRAEGDGDEAAREAAREALFRRPLARRLWPWLILLDATWTYARQVGWPRRRGEIVLCDRYVPDTLAELGARLRDARIAERPAGRLLRWLNRRPDCAWYLDVPAEAARQRQPAEVQQGTLELAERCAGVYNNLLSSYPLRVVDGAAPAERLSDRLIYETLTDYFDSFWSLLNGLLLSNPKASSRGGARATELPARPAPMPYVLSRDRQGETR